MTEKVFHLSPSQIAELRKLSDPEFHEALMLLVEKFANDLLDKAGTDGYTDGYSDGFDDGFEEANKPPPGYLMRMH